MVVPLEEALTALKAAVFVALVDAVEFDDELDPDDGPLEASVQELAVLIHHWVPFRAHAMPPSRTNFIANPPAN
jgi:hypothetical protein